jgi:Uma2 family endonuclease
MAEPVRKPDWHDTARFPEAPDPEPPEEEPGITLLRWVKFPGGELEQVAMPLTPERFLYTHLGDQLSQGKRHSDTARQIADMLDQFFRSAPDVLVTFDLRHYFGRGLPYPAPDVSVIRGVRNKDADRLSFNVKREGVSPCLVFEVVSPRSSPIRHTDLVTKVDLYRQAGVREYVIADRDLLDGRFRLLGYRLEGAGSGATGARYRPIEPDAQGRILSETTGLWFQTSPDGSRVRLFEYPSGRPLLTREEEETLREAAEERARRAEDEVARLRAELARLTGSSL